MSRDPIPRPEEPEPPTGPSPDGLRPTGLPTVLGWVAIGLVGGWALHPLCDRLGVVPPLVSAAQPLALLLLAAILGYVAWVTHRAVHVRRERLEAHQAVNRLMLGRASALVAALVAGGYVGYALSWIGDPAELADERLVRSLVAAGCALLAVVAGLLLERACRVHDAQ
ncbi:DUF3180 family protein [Nocardioides sp. LHD-245]|uniref:DUF3180 family protein n=1 Tax=Nocardioides sp. LHD-245 TaxID=3051387 RepID=UPI0027DF13A5|nr:DUF3180 family protein [Nocardioides sp. LHD-245]